MTKTSYGVFGGVTGTWSGANLLRMMPDQEYAESESNATVARAAGGNAATINYTWADENGIPQDGVILISNGEETGSIRVVWIDSWHHKPQWIELTGTIDEQGSLHVEASYGPQDVICRWRIHVDTGDQDHLKVRMDNVYGELDYQAVEITYSRPA